MGTACKNAGNLDASDEDDLEINVDDDSRSGSDVEGANGLEKIHGSVEKHFGYHRNDRKFIKNNCDINGYVSDHNRNKTTKTIINKSVSEDDDDDENDDENEKHYDKILRHYNKQAENVIRGYNGENNNNNNFQRARNCGNGKTELNSDENQSEYEDVGSRSNSPKTYIPSLMRDKSNERSESSSPLETSTASSAVLPFSISRLLSREKRHSEDDDRHSDRSTPSPKKSLTDENNRTAEGFDDSALGLYPHPAIVQFAAGGLNAASTRMPGFLYNTSAGVIRVPAHRPPVPGGISAPPGASTIPVMGSPFPWLAAMDPSFQRSAAAAFASQVVKERLSGKFFNFLIF